MAVVMASSTRSADDLIRYVLEPKSDQRGERYVMASGTGGLLVSLARDQMRDVRERWGKNEPGAYVQAYHVIQSFSARDELDPADPSDWMTAQDLGIALAEEVFAGRQVLVVTQRDGAGGCLHNHLVASSVNTETGDSLNSSVVMHARLVETHEAVLEREGFHQPDDLRQAYTDALDRRDRGESSRLRRAPTKEQRALIEATRHAQWQALRATAESGTARRLEPFSLLVLKHRIDSAVTARSTTD
ncbi:relaxase/mobilization nuclease domain-containing protein [Microbacterium sp. LWH13-1.2]